MEFNALSTRPFIGARDFELSKKFYRELGFEEVFLSPQMCVFKSGQLVFYLQNANIKEWIDNTMIFVEVKDVHQVYMSCKP